MKKSISNIGWSADEDAEVYTQMNRLGYQGLEIAPTRIFPDAPYAQLSAAAQWAQALKEEYGLTVSSMQSIWFGRQERLFGSGQDRQRLVDYTKKAIDFAQAIGCGNLVFGCPRNRVVPEGMESGRVMEIAAAFFGELGQYAYGCGTVLSMEANPPIYNTNYMNDTGAALELVELVDNPGFLLNLDIGAMICNQEDVNILRGKVHKINHVHISEPGLKPIQHRTLHGHLIDLLKEEHYRGFVSIEMGRQEKRACIFEALAYVEMCCNDL